MKISVMFMLVFSFSAWSQVRRPIPPRPLPAPRPGYICKNGDLFNYNRFIHRFYSSYECQPALRDIVNYGRFCDYSTLYDRNGYFLAQFNQQMDCRRALLRRP